MNIIYVSSCCSADKMAEMQEKGYFKGIVCAQKYHSLMMQGLSENIDGNVFAVSALPTNRKWTKKIFFKKDTERENKVSFSYSGFINFPLLRQLSLYSGTLREIKRLLKKGGNNVIVCDILNQSIASAARTAGKWCKTPVVGIVTDVPGHYVTYSNNRPSKNPIVRWRRNFSQKKMSEYDAFLFLTEAMNDVVNKNNKPYIVIEGHSDIEMRNRENSIDDKVVPNVIMYAGGVSKIYGLEMLVNAFRKINPDNWELHIYGKGDYDNELAEISKQDEKVKFFGIVPNAEVVDKQLRATLLVNPRPTNEDYVKYSFPSKTLECMVSGTPLITTALPGMPKEYNNYVYIFDKETEEGFAETLKKIIAVDKNELHSKGSSAKEFALQQKNNVIQAQKFYEFLCEL